MALNAADRKSIRAAEKAAKIVDANNQAVVVAIMSTESGRRYIWDKLTLANIFSTTFSTDSMQMAFNEGNRNQGLLLLNDIIEWCPEEFIQAMREANGRRTQSSTGQRNGSENGDGRVEGSGIDSSLGAEPEWEYHDGDEDRAEV